VRYKYFQYNTEGPLTTKGPSVFFYYKIKEKEKKKGKRKKQKKGDTSFF